MVLLRRGCYVVEMTHGLDEVRWGQASLGESVRYRAQQQVCSRQSLKTASMSPTATLQQECSGQYVCVPCITEKAPLNTDCAASTAATCCLICNGLFSIMQLCWCCARSCRVCCCDSGGPKPSISGCSRLNGNHNCMMKRVPPCTVCAL